MTDLPLGDEQECIHTAADNAMLVHSDTHEEVATIPLRTLFRMSSRAATMVERDDRPTEKHLFIWMHNVSVPVIRNLADWINRCHGQDPTTHIKLSSNPIEVVDACVYLLIPPEMVNIHAAVREWMSS